MAFFKFTNFVGRGKSGNIISGSRNGHWRPETIAKAARKAGVVGRIEFTHHAADMSGRGRGGHDGRYEIDDQGNARKIASWSEFGKEHA